MQDAFSVVDIHEVPGFVDADLGGDPFTALTTGVDFQVVGPGREGAVAMALYKEHDGAVMAPIARSTTRYESRHQAFTKAHTALAAAIEQGLGKGPLPPLNNALVKKYDSRYKTMGFHSDMAQDLHGDSYICLYSCYPKHEAGGPPRLPPGSL
jgi:hypothetical protein